jgi:hypothetical protein
MALWPVAYSSRPAQNRTSTGFLARSTPGLVLLFIAIGSSFSGPSVTRAHQLRESGHVEAARKEAQAAVELDEDAGEARKLHDELQLEILKANRDPASLWTHFTQAQFFAPEAREEAEGHAVAYTAEYASNLQNKGEYRQSLVLLAGVPVAIRQADTIRRRFVAAHRNELELHAQPLRNNAPLAERLRACEQIKQPLGELNALRALGKKQVQSIESACASAAAQETARIKEAERAAKAAQLRAEREAQAAERRYERAVEAWAMAPLRCGDGTSSPSCVCGQSSRRGCCSHHGGVSGCSQPYPQR